MFIGHFALGFAAKRIAPKQSLAVLIAAPIFFDALWPVLCALGIERFTIAPGDTVYTPLAFDHYPWSHSLLMGLVWGGLFYVAARRATGDRAGALVAGALVVSHWLLDFVTHRPDMPLWPGGPKLGLGLWNSVPGTVIVESLLFVVGVAIYLGATKAKNRTGSVALWLLVGFLALGYVANSQGMAPPSQTVVIVSGIVASVLMPAWGWWIERNRAKR